MRIKIEKMTKEGLSWAVAQTLVDQGFMGEGTYLSLDCWDKTIYFNNGSYGPREHADFGYSLRLWGSLIFEHKLNIIHYDDFVLVDSVEFEKGHVVQAQTKESRRICEALCLCFLRRYGVKSMNTSKELA